jgi:hypothetical protein
VEQIVEVPQVQRVEKIVEKRWSLISQWQLQSRRCGRRLHCPRCLSLSFDLSLFLEAFLDPDRVCRTRIVEKMVEKIIKVPQVSQVEYAEKIATV